MDLDFDMIKNLDPELAVRKLMGIEGFGTTKVWPWSLPIFVCHGSRVPLSRAITPRRPGVVFRRSNRKRHVSI